MIHTRFAQAVGRVPTLLGQDGVVRPGLVQRLDEEVVRAHVALVHDLPRVRAAANASSRRSSSRTPASSASRPASAWSSSSITVPWPADRSGLVRPGAAEADAVPHERPQLVFVGASGDELVDAPLHALGRDVVDDPPNGLPCTAELTASRTMAATAVTRPVVIITPMLLEAIDVTIIVTMPPTKMRAHTMRKAFNVTGPCCQSGNPARVPAGWSGTVAGVTEPAVQVKDLGKTFRVPEASPASGRRSAAWCAGGPGSWKPSAR